MAVQVGPLEVRCDAPPYRVVRACERLGIHRPLDVPWHRRSGSGKGCAGLYGLRDWVRLFCLLPPLGAACPCGRCLPRPRRYTFGFAARETSYLLAQCPACRAVTWAEA
jgi:hypothetical protein